MTTAARRLPSFDELYAEVAALPQGVTGEILVPGQVRTMSRPGRAHRRVAKRCYQSLRGFDADVQGRGWWIEVEVEIRLGERLAVPDLAGWRVERVPELPDENPLTIVPYWCCEMLSPTTARDDRLVKLPLYASEGVGWVWLVDPMLRAVEVYQTLGGRPTLMQTATDDATETLAPFDTPIALASWW